MCCTVSVCEYVCRMYALLFYSDFTYVFFFFFQAEDGIRDYKVTGVQTCALPICAHHDGAGNLARRCPFGLLSKIKYEHQGGKRKHDRKRNRQGHKKRMKSEYRSQTHGRHADVMHGCNTAAHNHAAG